MKNLCPRESSQNIKESPPYLCIQLTDSHFNKKPKKLINCISHKNLFFSESEVFLFPGWYPARDDGVDEGFICEFIRKKKHANTSSETLS